MPVATQKTITISDDYDNTVKEYEAILNTSNFKCPLLFWKQYHMVLPSLGQLAKKYLGVPASAAQVYYKFYNYKSSLLYCS